MREVNVLHNTRICVGNTRTPDAIIQMHKRGLTYKGGDGSRANVPGKVKSQFGKIYNNILVPVRSTKCVHKH